MNNDFIVNDFITIKKFKLINDKIHEFLKFGVLYDYKEFEGFIKNKKVRGFVCLKDDNIYNMREVLEWIKFLCLKVL